MPVPTQDFATQISAAREQLGWTQEKAAREADVSLRSYQGYERGENIPREDRARKIRQALGLTDANQQALASNQSQNSIRLARKLEDGVEKGEVLVPVYGTASAGDGCVPLYNCIVEYMRMSVPEYVTRFRRIPPEGGKGEMFGLFKIVGSSAAPVYFDGETVPVEIFDPPVQHFTSDNVYIFRWQEQILLKQLRLLDDRVVEARALNPGIEPYRFRPGGDHDFAVLARVIANEKQQLYSSFIGRFMRTDIAA